MAAKNPVFEEKIKRAIRDALALDPIITAAALHERINRQFKYEFDHRYIAKLRNKVFKQELNELDRARIEERVRELKETYRISRERLLRVIYWSPENALPGIKAPMARDIAEAAKNLALLDIAVLQAEVANGLYRKPVEEIAKTIHYEPLPDEVRMVVVAAWKRGGMLPPAAVEQLVPQSQVATS